MNKNRYDELAWFDQLEQEMQVARAKRLLKLRYERQARVAAPTLFQRLLTRFKAFLGASR